MKWLLFAAMMAGLVSADSLNAAPVGILFLQEEEDNDADRDGVMSDEKQDDGEESKEEEEELDPDLEAAFPSDIAPVGLSKGKLMPQIEGKDFEGVKFQLSDYRGKVIMLDFWGDW